RLHAAQLLFSFIKDFFEQLGPGPPVPPQPPQPLPPEATVLPSSESFCCSSASISRSRLASRSSSRGPAIGANWRASALLWRSRVRLSCARSAEWPASSLCRAARLRRSQRCGQGVPALGGEFQAHCGLGASLGVQLTADLRLLAGRQLAGPGVRFEFGSLSDAQRTASGCSGSLGSSRRRSDQVASFFLAEVPDSSRARATRSSKILTGKGVRHVVADGDADKQSGQRQRLAQLSKQRQVAEPGRKSNPLEEVPKERASFRERKRMFSINSAFEELRSHIPTFPYERRLSKIDTLRLAIGYIAFLRDVLDSDQQCRNYSRQASGSPATCWPRLGWLRCRNLGCCPDFADIATLTKIAYKIRTPALTERLKVERHELTAAVPEQLRHEVAGVNSKRRRLHVVHHGGDFRQCHSGRLWPGGFQSLRLLGRLPQAPQFWSSSSSSAGSSSGSESGN
uniref:BHLH domain-containing protein n=1 Tax=Macrostomum lignano TaxID=282301 RepID=A0A1I8JP69_9PLAT